MSNRPLLFALSVGFAVTAVSARQTVAAPNTRPTPVAKTCPLGKGTTTLFEVEHRVRPNTLRSLLTIHSNGAWTYDSQPEGKPKHTTSGCFDDASLDLVKHAVAAPWTVTPAAFRCEAISASFTVYRVNGKEVLSSTLCDGKQLDTKSEQALQAALKVVTPLMVPAW